MFDAPRRARALFEAVVRDNLDLGRPHEVELIFSGRPVRRGRPRKRPETFKTRLVTDGVDVTVNVFYKHSRIKQYLRDGRAWRIETVVNSPDDFGVQRRLHNLGALQAKARAANRRILDVQRAGQGCAMTAPGRCRCCWAIRCWTTTSSSSPPGRGGTRCWRQPMT